MSGRRLERAFGRSGLGEEVRFFDVEPAQSEKAFQEIVGFVLEGLREGAVTVSEEGGKKRRLALAIPPLQKPHPPLWYGIQSPQAPPGTCGRSSPKRARTISSASSPSATSRRKRRCARSPCSQAK